MGKSSLSVRYTSGKPRRYFEDLKEPMPSTRAIAWCMARTEVARLFSKDDMREFLFRLPILFHLRGLVEDWLMEGTLFTYFFRGKEYTLSVDDLVMHAGLEAYDHYLNVTPRDRYLNRVKWSMNFPLTTGYAEAFPQLRIDGTKLVVDHLVYGPELTPELIDKAAFFAADVMKIMPGKYFYHACSNLVRKKKELAKRKKMIEAIHDFDLREIPCDMLKACLEIISCSCDAEKILRSPDDADSIDRQIRPAIFLAWTWANHFTSKDGLFLPGKEEFTRDYLDYEAEDGGYNLTYNIGISLPEKLIPVLKGLKAEGLDNDDCSEFENEEIII